MERIRRFLQRLKSTLTRQNLYYWICSRQPNNKIKNDIHNWRAYLYLKHKYSSYLHDLPATEESGKIIKKIWWCWLQGEENAPLMCKACLSSLRKNLPDFDICVVTELNIPDLVELPTHVVTKYKNGIIPRAHFADIIRTALIVKYGGVWIDSCVYCTGYTFPILNEPLFVFRDWKFNQNQPLVASNWFISGEIGNPILQTQLSMLYKYWEDFDGLIDYFFYHILFKIVVEDKYPFLWKKVKLFSNLPPHYLQFELFNQYKEERWKQIAHMSDFHKLTWKDGRTEKDFRGTYFEHILKEENLL